MDDVAVPAPAPGYLDDEHMVWTGRPGQITNWRVYFTMTVAMALLLVFVPRPYTLVGLAPLLIAGWYWLTVRCSRWELTSQRLRLRLRAGILTRRIEEIELYRVVDSSMTAPLVYRLVGRGNLAVVTTDQTAQRANLYGIADAEGVRNKLRHSVEAARRAKGVRFVE